MADTPYEFVGLKTPARASRGRQINRLTVSDNNQAKDLIQMRR
jgi:hypothetical protein